MITLEKEIKNLNLTKEEKNNFSQILKATTFEKHFNNLSKENLLILKRKFETKLKQCKLYDSILHCKYALNKINNALILK